MQINVGGEQSRYMENPRARACSRKPRHVRRSAYGDLAAFDLLLKLSDGTVAMRARRWAVVSRAPSGFGLRDPPRCGYARRVSAQPRSESFELRHEEVIMRYLFVALFIGASVAAASAQNYGIGSNPSDQLVADLHVVIQKINAKLPIAVNDRVDITSVSYDGNAIRTTYVLKVEISDQHKISVLDNIEKDVRSKACTPNRGDDLKMKFKRIYEYYSISNAARVYLGSISINPCDKS